MSPALASGFFTTEPPGKPLCDNVILVKQNTEQQGKVHPVSCSYCQVNTCQDTGLFLPGHRHLSQANEGGRVPRPKNYRKMPVGKARWWRHPREAVGCGDGGELWLKVKVLVAQSCLSLQPHGLWPTRLLSPWNSPGKDTGVGSHSRLQGFPTQGLNSGLLHYRQVLYHLSLQGSPSPTG